MHLPPVPPTPAREIESIWMSHREHSALRLCVHERILSLDCFSEKRKGNLIILSPVFNLSIQHGSGDLQYVNDPVGKIETRVWYALGRFVVEFTLSVGLLKPIERGVGNTFP